MAGRRLPRSVQCSIMLPIVSRSGRPDKERIEMEDGLWQIGRLILIVGGIIAVIIGIFWLDYTGWLFRIQKWFWGAIFFVGGLISFGFMIDSIDFDKPVLLSVYWSTFGYLVLTIVLLLIGTAILSTKMES